MSNDPRETVSNLFTQVDITPSNRSDRAAESGQADDDQRALLRAILTSLDRQNRLMEELVSQHGAAQKQRQNDLEQWKQANPELAKKCRQAAEALGRVQAEFLDRITYEVEENGDGMMDGEFLLAEFVDRFGPRLAHLNGVLQVLSQLGAPGAATSSSQ